MEEGEREARVMWIRSLWFRNDGFELSPVFNSDSGGRRMELLNGIGIGRLPSIGVGIGIGIGMRIGDSTGSIPMIPRQRLRRVLQVYSVQESGVELKIYPAFYRRATM